jgi:hypothetical protein
VITWVRPTLIALTLLGVIFLSVFIKTTCGARDEYTQGTAALQEGHYAQAITHFNRALHWYSPGSAVVLKSIEALWQIGIEAQSRGDYRLSLDAFQTLRSGLYSARSFYTPYPEWISRCDEQIATAYARHPAPPFSESPPAIEARKKEMLDILKTPTAPDVTWSLLCESGFIGWIACTIGFILRVFATPKGFHPQRAFVWGGLVICFYALWILGMLNA